MTKGACGVYFGFPQLLEDLNLLKEVEVGKGKGRGRGRGRGRGEGLVLSYSVRSLERCTSYLVSCLGFNTVLYTWPLMLHKVAQHVHKVVQHLHTEERLCISSMY